MGPLPDTSDDLRHKVLEATGIRIVLLQSCIGMLTLRMLW